MKEHHLTEDILDRMVRAVEKVRDRLNRAATALEAAGIRYAVIGGNAVAAWASDRAFNAIERAAGQPGRLRNGFAINANLGHDVTTIVRRIRSFQ